MPFHARCVFCGQQLRVPDHALGASGRCPKCANFFTLAPCCDVKPIIPTCSMAKVSQSTPMHGASLLAMAEVAISHEKPGPKPYWIDPFGLGALLSLGATLLCALTPALCAFVVPLSGAGLILGLAGLLPALAKGRYRLPVPFAGTILGGVVLLAALTSPNLLGPVYLASRGKDVVDPWVVRVVPLPDSYASAGPMDPEWVDARQAALQQGPVHVQVTSVAVRSEKARSSPAKKTLAKECLCIRLRTQLVEAASEFATKRSQTPGRLEKVRPMLTDNTGRVYQPRDVVEVAAVSDKRKSSVFPVAFQDEVLVFEAPPPGLEYLRLELPAEAWGGKGAFRFTIPSSMIGDRQSSRTGSTGLAGRR